MKSTAPLGQAELEILRYVQDHHPITVRETADHLSATKGIVRTTVLNVLERLRQKNYLTRKKIDGIYHYSPRQEKKDLLRGLVGQFVQKSLAGSVSPFMAYLSEDAKLTPAELKEMREIIESLERKAK